MAVKTKRKTVVAAPKPIVPPVLPLPRDGRAEGEESFGGRRAKALLEIKRVVLAERKFLYFLEHVKIRETTPGGEEGGVIKFEKWPHLVAVATLLSARDGVGGILNRLLVWLKARQIGASWLIAAYVLWVAMYRAMSEVLMFSAGEREAWKLLGKCKFIWEHLPVLMRVKIDGQWNKGDVKFVNGSTMEALPSTEGAGRMYTATVVWMDEGDYHPYLEANFAAVKPTIDAGGQLILLSTSNYENVGGVFKTVYIGAPGNRWMKIFYGWKARPDRDADFRERLLKESPDPARVVNEYPETEEEALMPPRQYRVFDMAVYDSMMKTDVRPPIEEREMGGIWQRFQPGKKYSVWSDTSRGIGEDFSVTCIMDCDTGYIVADVFTNRADADTFAYACLELLHLYHDPLWAIEANDLGYHVIQVAERMKYPRLWHKDQDIDPLHPGGVGWHTERRNRGPMWENLVGAFRARLVTIPRKEGLEQFAQVIRSIKGRPEAREGGHDCYPKTVAGCWYIREWAMRSYAGREGLEGSVPRPVVVRVRF